MFEIQPSPEFSAWFESLAPAAAEEVACALDLTAAVGAAAGPSRVSRALLWFDGTGGELAPWLDGRFLAVTAALGWQELWLWQKEVLACLDSPAFRGRLALLDPKAASIALAAVESLKARLSFARSRLRLEQRPASAPSVKDSFFEVLRLIGLEPAAVLNTESGLCELTISATEPRLRVLFGLDAAAKRLVLFSGEALDRVYYGEAVKSAERRWREYCEREPRARARKTAP